MADAWGNRWGSSWSNAWGGNVPSPPDNDIRVTTAKKVLLCNYAQAAAAIKRESYFKVRVP